MPVVLGHCGYGLVDGDPRIVDQDVEPTMSVDDLGEAAPAVLGRADVAAMR